jgi:hydrogenase large subunit
MSTDSPATSRAIHISPVTRIEGHLDINALVEDGTVFEAFSSGTSFRGFELILKGRDPADATHYTQRICGVCPVSHGMASAKALADAFAITPLTNGRILRNLILGANFLQSHILHFYHLALLDYVDPAGHAVLDKSPWRSGYQSEDLLSLNSADASKSEAAAHLLANYVQALGIRRKTHQMGAIFGGKLPCSPVFVPSGCTETVMQGKIDAFEALLVEITDFIALKYIPDVKILAEQFPEYRGIGRGCGNLLTYGVFDTGAGCYFSPGTFTSSGVGPVEPNVIGEDLACSYYDELSGDPEVGKNGAYSWIKAPRYDGTVFEVGPLARMKIYDKSNEFDLGISVMDRLLARALESFEVSLAMADWLGDLQVGQPTHEWRPLPPDGIGMGLTEAPRGALGHWIKVIDSKVSRYQIITPTAWNASPHDEVGQPGPMEQALIGTTVRDFDNPIELLRVVHSFDPCLACSVHTVHQTRAN